MHTEAGELVGREKANCEARKGQLTRVRVSEEEVRSTNWDLHPLRLHQLA